MFTVPALYNHYKSEFRKIRIRFIILQLDILTGIGADSYCFTRNVFTYFRRFYR